MQDAQTQQQRKWVTQIQNQQLHISYFDNFCYQGILQQSPFYDLYVIKDIIDKGQVQILVKTYIMMKIRIMTIINLELYTKQYTQTQNLKKRVQQLEDEKRLKWQEEDLNSTQPFDIDCLYKVIFNNNAYTVICHYVDPNNLYHYYSNGSHYTVSKGNRKASGTGHAVNKIWKQKIQ